MFQLIEYVIGNQLDQVREEDAAALDVVNIAFAHVVSDRVVWDHPECKGAIERLRRLNPNMKILLSVGGWSAGGFSEAAGTAEGRKLFTDTAVELVGKYDLDGIDIDWEYPCMSLAGIKADPSDKENFTLLLKQLRESLESKEKGRYLMSIAAGGDSYSIRNIQLDEVMKYLDYIQIMTYDLRGGFTTVTGHHTSLYATPTDLSEVCADKIVRDYINAGVEPGKLTIGAAFYGRNWTGVKDVDHGLCQEAGSVGKGGPGYGELLKNYIGKNGYVRYWDEDAKAPWLFNGEHFISYDDEQSLACKVEYLKRLGLKGIMCWQYSDDSTHALTEFLRKQLDL